MAWINSPRFPDTLAYGAMGGPGFVTNVIMLRDGREQRNQRQAQALRQWDVGQVNRSLSQTQTLIAFFNAIAEGQTNTFRFKDFLPGESSATGQPLGMGTGSSATYQLVKRYDVSGYTYDQRITKPVSGTVVIYIDGTPTGSFSLDDTTGIVTISASNGAVLTADYAYDVPVHFLIDTLPIQRVSQDTFSWEAIPVQETRTV